jgi:protein-L-isoaspartate(D-aspartate) O-methyltransferase
VHADGNQGLPKAAPFDGIIVAAAAPGVPQALLQQLASGGRMIVPVGADSQVLCLIEKTSTGLTEKWLDAVHFVPLRGGRQ